MAGAVEGDVFIGRKAQELKGLLKIKYPIEHGIVSDWDDMERIWKYIYEEELKTASEEVRVKKFLIVIFKIYISKLIQYIVFFFFNSIRYF
jgi:actin-related protein